MYYHGLPMRGYVQPLDHNKSAIHWSVVSHWAKVYKKLTYASCKKPRIHNRLGEEKCSNTIHNPSLSVVQGVYAKARRALNECESFKIYSQNLPK